MTAEVNYDRAFFAGTDGKPLDSGSLYIGIANQDPETHPLSCYWDAALTVPVTQPVSISAGYALHNGSRAVIYASATSYSMRIKDRAGALVDYAAETHAAIRDGDNVSAAYVTNTRTGTGSVSRTLAQIIADSVPVHPKDFGCAGDGTTDDTANLAKMFASGYTKFDGGGLTYKISAGLAQVFGKDASVEIKNFNFVSSGVADNTVFLTVQGASSGSAMTMNAAAAGATSITLTSGSAAAGDKLLISSSDLWSDTAITAVPSVTMGEWVDVLSVAGSVLTLAQPLRYDYSTSPTATKYLMPRRVLLENITGTSDNTARSHSAVAMNYIADAVAKNVIGIKCSNAGVQFNGCPYAYSEDCGNFDPAIGIGLAYGVVTSLATRQATHVRPRGRGCRHVSANGGYVGVVASVTVIDPVGDNQFEGIVDAHAAVDEQFVLFGNIRISGNSNSKIISSQARRLTVTGCQAYNVANAIVWYPACTAYPANGNFTACDIQATFTAIYCANNSTQQIEYINIEGHFIGGTGGVSGDGVTISHSTNLAVHSQTPGRIKTVRFRGRAKGFQRGFYALTGTQGQTIDYADLDGTFVVGDTAAGHFPVYFSFNNDADMTNVRIRGVTEKGVYGVQLLHTLTADVDIYATGYSTDAIFNYQSGDVDAESRFNLRASGAGQKMGSAIANGTTAVDVTTTAARSGSRIRFALKTAGGTPGTPRQGTITSGTKFQFSSTAGDTSTYWWWLENPVTGP